MKRKSLREDICAIARTLHVIGDWWSLLIIREALAGVRRFSDFHRNLGAAKNILTNRLKALVANGILEVAPASDGSAYQEYLLTKKGEALLPILISLGQWGSDYLFDKSEPCSVVIDAAKKRPLAHFKMLSADGRVLQPKDVLIRA